MDQFLNFKKLRHINTLIGFLLTVSLVGTLIHWHREDQLTPIDDEGFNIYQSQIILKSFKEKGVIDGLDTLFFKRAHKPVLHMGIGVPFLLASGGDTERAVSTFSVFSFMLFILICLMIEDLVLKRIFFFPTVFLSSLPFVYVKFLGFYFETTFLVFLMGSIYFLIKSKNLKDVKYSTIAGIMFGLALTVRPALGLLIWLPLVLIYIGTGLFQKRYKILSTILLISLPAFYLLLFVKFSDNGKLVDAKYLDYLWRILIVIFLVSFEYFFYFKNKKIKNLFIFSRVSFLVAITWIGPSLVATYKWGFGSSFGQWAEETGMVTSMTSDWKVYLDSISGQASIFIMLYILFVYLILRAIRKKIKSEEYYSDIYGNEKILYPLLLSSFPAICIFFLSNTRDLRFVHSSTVILYFIVLLVVFTEPFFKKNISILSMNLLLIFPVYSHFQYVNGGGGLKLLKAINQNIDHRYKVIRSFNDKNPVDFFLEKLSSVVSLPASIDNVRVAVLNMNPFTELGLVINHSSLNLKKMERKLSFEIDSILTLSVDDAEPIIEDKKFIGMLKTLPDDLHRQTRGNYERKLQYIVSNYTHVLLAPTNYQCSKDLGYQDCGLGHYRNIDLSERIYMKYKSNDLAELNLNFVGEFDYYSHKGTAGKAILFRTLRSNL